MENGPRGPLALASAWRGALLPLASCSTRRWGCGAWCACPRTCGCGSVSALHLYPGTCVCAGWVLRPIVRRGWGRACRPAGSEPWLRPMCSRWMLALARRALGRVASYVEPETQPRLKSRRSFATGREGLLSTALPGETKAHWIARMWSVGWGPSASRLCEYIVSPSKCCPGSDLSWQAWVKLNRLRAGVGHFVADVWGWGLSGSPAWGCGAGRWAANHIITKCPLYLPPGGLHGLIDVDADAATCEWRSNHFFWFFGFTHKKKNQCIDWAWSINPPIGEYTNMSGPVLVWLHDSPIVPVFSCKLKQRISNTKSMSLGWLYEQSMRIFKKWLQICPKFLRNWKLCTSSAYNVFLLFFFFRGEKTPCKGGRERDRGSVTSGKWNKMQIALILLLIHVFTFVLRCVGEVNNEKTWRSLTS